MMFVIFDINAYGVVNQTNYSISWDGTEAESYSMKSRLGDIVTFGDGFRFHLRLSYFLTANWIFDTGQIQQYCVVVPC